MANGKTGKYFKYAIGEIILVVIGILIALQINNWNETRKEKLKENVTILNLHTEFSENLNDLEIVMIKLEATTDALEHVFKMFHKDSIYTSSRQADSIMNKILASPTWKPSEFVLNDLKNSGGLSKLSSDKLKKLLFQWNRFFNELQDTMNLVESTSTELIRYIKNNGSLRNIDAFGQKFKSTASQLNINNALLLSDYKFENYINDKLFVLNSTKIELEEAKILIQKILQETAID